MKKIISVLLLIVLIFSLSACKKEENTSSEIDTAAQNDISSIGNSTENATTSEENSTSTPSANTTPSNTIPSNSTPGKTEEPKSTVVAGEYTVTFDYGYDNKKTTAKSKNYKVAKPKEPIRSGYKFMGWYAANESEQWNFTGHAVTADMTLTAKWMKNIYDISYSTVVNGENTNILKEKIGDPNSRWHDPVTGESGPGGEKGVRAGFEGYSVAIYDGTEEDTVQNKTSYNTNDYDFCFFQVPTSFSVDSNTFTVPELSYEGCKFLGWTYEGQTTPVKTVIIPKGTTKDYKLVANWERK